MNRPLRLIAVIGTLALPTLLGPSTAADHIPGHDDGDPVFPVPIPGQNDFSGGIVFVTAIGPNAGSEVTNTRFDVTFVSDGATPASQLLMNVGVVLEDGDGGSEFVEIEVSGADLGFGSGPGTFHGELETAAFNGIVAPGLFPPYSIVDLAIGATTGGIDGTGYFLDSFIYFDLLTPVACPADLDASGAVDVDDLVEVITSWGACPVHVDCPADIDSDGTVGVDDLIAVIVAWGEC